MNITPVQQTNYSKVIALLKQNKLPTEDITEAIHLFSIVEKDQPVGVIGVEPFDGVGLLRSFCVAGDRRNSGLGNKLVDFIETYATENGLKELYLLTTTADGYFAKRGYERIDRKRVPEAIKQTSEFSSVCPSSAQVIKRSLG